MYSDGFVSSTFWAVVFCGIAVVASPGVGILCGLMVLGLLGPTLTDMDKRDHSQYRIHNGYYD